MLAERLLVVAKGWNMGVRDGAMGQGGGWCRRRGSGLRRRRG